MIWAVPRVRNLRSSPVSIKSPSVRLSREDDKEEQGTGNIHTPCLIDKANLIMIPPPTVLNNASSTRFCSVCKIEVKLAFGGEANWTAHTSSNAHRKKEAAVSSSKPLTSLAKYLKESPCTNHPLACPLCPKTLPAVWKYN